MAQYIFVKTKRVEQSLDILKKLELICNILTPDEIKEQSQNTVKNWPHDPTAFYAIQNSANLEQIKKDTLLIGWQQTLSQNSLDVCSTEADGSYAVIQDKKEQVHFFTDQFGSRTLWYYLNENILIISTSQRAIVALKSAFRLNKKAIAYYLSSGIQGPFISWDNDIQQVRPDLQYHFDATHWSLDSKKKTGMALPPSGSVKTNDYLELFQQQITTTLEMIINSPPEGQVLMPLSGGLDSRLLFTLSINAGLDKKINLVNWGVLNQPGTFDDKTAAHKITNFYGKNLLNKFLPSKIDSFDQTLDAFVDASEGRIADLNAYTDCFKMWQEFFHSGYRLIIRGDIPFTEGLALNNEQARANNGLKILSDYSNKQKFPFDSLIEIQKPYDINRLDDESLIRWRDRTFVDICMPMEVSAYSDLISDYAENRSPMMNWSLFKLYMGLSDKDKGNKLHIQKLCSKFDRSKVSTHAVSSLRSIEFYFDHIQGKEYLLHKLSSYKDSGHFSTELIDSVIESISKQTFDSAIPKNTSAFKNTKALISDRFPLLLKAYLQSKRPTNISATTIAYRLILIEKIIAMYELDAKELKENN